MSLRTNLPRQSDSESSTTGWHFRSLRPGQESAITPRYITTLERWFREKQKYTTIQKKRNKNGSGVLFMLPDPDLNTALWDHSVALLLCNVTIPNCK